MKVTPPAAGRVPDRNDYYCVELRLTPANGDAADYLASLLADAGYESFEQDEEHPGATMKAYVQAPLFDVASLEGAIDELGDVFVGTTVDGAAEFVEGRDWNSEWERNYFKPIVIGGRVAVHSSFHTDIPEAEYDIVIDPRMAFGTGHHATTTLMMQALLARDEAGLKVVDMGTGTGILAILATMRGAAEVTAIEIDPAAADNAADNIAGNLGDRAACVTLVRGDASALASVHDADIFLANINRNIITTDMPAYVGAMRAGGCLIVSGFYVADREVVEAAAVASGLQPAGAAELDGWLSLTFKK